MFLQKLKTRVINNNCNPVWNEQLTLSIKDVNDPIRLVSRRVYQNCLLALFIFSLTILDNSLIYVQAVFLG